MNGRNKIRKATVLCESQSGRSRLACTQGKIQFKLNENEDDTKITATLKETSLGIDIKQKTLSKLFEQHNTEFEKKDGHRQYSINDTALFYI